MFFKGLIYMNGMDMPLNVVVMEPQPDVDVHGHDFTELVMVYSGEADYVTTSGRSRIKTGDLLVTYMDQQHGYENTDKLVIGNVIFDPARLPLPVLDMCNSVLFNRLFAHNSKGHRNYHLPIMTLAREELEELWRYILNIRTHKQENKIGSNFNALAEFMQLAGLLVRISAQENNREWHMQKQIAELINYLNTHYREKISLEAMAESTRMSVRTMLRQFEISTGDTPVNYVLKRRIVHAAGLLGSTKMSIAEIAYASGFNDANYFSRQFRRVTGFTPAGFRKQSQ